MACAADHHHHPRARDRPGVPAAQAPRPAAVVYAVSAGEAHVFYPEATPERCTAALLLEVDPVALVRGPHTGTTGQATADLARQYVNDRPYAASACSPVAIKEAFRTALTGRCDARPDLAAARIPLADQGPGAALPRRRPARAQRLRPARLDASTRKASRSSPPEWGDSPYLDLRLTGRSSGSRTR